jgi:protein KRI1
LEREQVLHGVVDIDAAERDELADIKDKTHMQQVEEVKNAFKAAIDEMDDEEDDSFLIKRDKSNFELEQEEHDYKSFLLESMAQVGGEGYFNQYKDATGEKVDPNDKFLMEYILGRGWIDTEDKKKNSIWLGDDNHPAPQVNEEEDAELVDASENFERVYNFRYEEAAALEGEVGIKTYAREIGDSVRRKDDKRARERERRKERKDVERKQKEEEIKRLKNLKREEILKKLREIAEITGNPNVGFDEVDLEADYDPEEYDEKMNSLFDDSYYAVDVIDEDAEKPEFEDDIDISDIAPAVDVIKTVLAVPEQVKHQEPPEEPKKKKKKRKRNDDDEDDFIMVPDADEMDVEQPVAKKSKSDSSNNDQKSSKKDALDQFDELFRLDYEDIVAGIPTRFRYRDVRPASFGLSTDDILEADETDLNQFVSLKKLAPYRKPENEEKDIRKSSKRIYEFKKKLREKRLGIESSVPKAEGRDQEQERLDSYLPRKNKKDTRK